MFYGLRAVRLIPPLLPLPIFVLRFWAFLDKALRQGELKLNNAIQNKSQRLAFKQKPSGQIKHVRTYVPPHVVHWLFFFFFFPCRPLTASKNPPGKYFLGEGFVFRVAVADGG
jgi:hypothetical protein